MKEIIIKLKEIFLILIFLGLIFIGGFTLGTLERNYEISETNVNMTGRTGVYYISEEIYCVKLKGRTLSEIERTDYHEMSHHLVNKDFEHFCTDRDIINQVK